VAKLFDAAPTDIPTRRSLDGEFEPTGYLSRFSDIVALLVFDHQMHMMNLLTRIGWEARVANYGARTPASIGHAPGVSSDAPIPLRDAAEELVDYMLFVDEARLASPVRGSSGFAERFSSAGPRDRRSRSLRDLDLQTRLMRYPCSYMIYSPAFDALPAEAKDAIYQRMWRILTGELGDGKYKRLSAADRQAIVEILRDTKSDLPAYFL
jgi:hypothetical protein